MAGKGSKPRSCFSKDFKQNFDQIVWESQQDKPECKEIKVKKGKITYKY